MINPVSGGDNGSARTRRRRLIAVWVVALAVVLTVGSAFSSHADAATASNSTSTSSSTKNEAENGSAAEDQQTSTQNSNQIVAVSIGELTSGGLDMDNLTVQVTGEVVGDLIDAGNKHTWVTLEQDGETVAIYMSDSFADQIQHCGDYGEVGDTITVVGTFHLDCSAHEGDVDIHAVKMTKVSDGYASMEEPDAMAMRVAILLIALGVATGFAYWRLRERLR